MTMRHRLIALFVAVVFILGTAYVPEAAFARNPDETAVTEAAGDAVSSSEETLSEQEDIQLTPIKGHKQDDMLRPIGGNTPVEDDLVQEASGDEVAPALGEGGNELPAAYTENMGKAKIRDQGLTSLCWAFSAATIAELNRGK